MLQTDNYHQEILKLVFKVFVLCYMGSVKVLYLKCQL